MSVAFTEMCHYNPAWNCNSKINNMFLNLERAGDDATCLLHCNEHEIYHIQFGPTSLIS